MTNIQLAQAKKEDADFIWSIIQFAIDQRKADGSDQWQDGYPNNLSSINI